MIQFSDLTYVQCALIHIGIIIWSIIYISHHRNSGGISNLPRDEAEKEKQRGSGFHMLQFCTIFLYISLIMGIVFHAWTSWFKYQVGLVRIPNIPTTWYIFRPLDAWNYSQAQFLYFMEILGMFAWAIKNLSLHIAVGAWWYYSQSIMKFKDRSFQPTWSEIPDYHKSLFFKLSCLFQILIFITFITMELCFTNNTVLNLSIPQLVILFQTFVLMIIVWWTTLRLGRCGGSYPPNIPSVILKRIDDVFKQLFYLGFWMSLEFSGIFFVDLDGVTDFSLGVLTRKGILDLCTAVFVFGYHATLVHGFCILYPKRSFAIDMKRYEPIYITKQHKIERSPTVVGASPAASVGVYQHSQSASSRSTSLSELESSDDADSVSS